VRDPAALADEFDKLNGDVDVDVVTLDVTDAESVARAGERCADLTMLVNNAGYFANRRLVLTDDLEAARQEMEVNYFGVLATTRRLHGARSNGGGAIINVRPLPVHFLRRSWAATRRRKLRPCFSAPSPERSSPSRAPMSSP